jgi:hypothetical protein
MAMSVTATATATMFGSLPADAATNKYTAAGACSHDFGGTWANTTDGHREIWDHSLNSDIKVGDVYLMYNSASGNNCVVTLKAVYLGQATYVSANLKVEDVGSYSDKGNYLYYAAVQHAARDKCVAYSGAVFHGHDWLLSNGRANWGNCG